MTGILTEDIRGWNLELTGNRIPVGISFFTFQAISFVVDMARDPKPKKPLIQDTALYISFFPQLIAGPIVRYNTVAEEIRERHENLDDFARGVNRFIIGLGKRCCSPTSSPSSPTPRSLPTPSIPF